MTLTDLTQTLARFDADLQVRLTTAHADFGDSYHLTEVTLADITGFDCGSNTRTWREVGLHVRDANGGPRMNVGKLGAILAKAATTLDGIADLPLHISAAPGNSGVSRYEVANFDTNDGILWVTLKGGETICKALMPADNASTAPRSSCCA